MSFNDIFLAGNWRKCLISNTTSPIDSNFTTARPIIVVKHYYFAVFIILRQYREVNEFRLIQRIFNAFLRFRDRSLRLAIFLNDNRVFLFLNFFLLLS